MTFTVDWVLTINNQSIIISTSLYICVLIFEQYHILWT